MQSNKFSTLFIGQKLIHLTEVDSTNSFLKNLISNSEPLPEGSVIMADAQLAGRGQANNVWHAEPGKNLTFSILLKPTFLTVEQQFNLNIAVSVAIQNTLKKYKKEGFSIKWPNDIYYNDKKIGGILIENILHGNIYKSAIVGIGLNVNQVKFNTEVEDKASSICRILGEELDLQTLLGQIFTELEVAYLQLMQGKYQILLQNYLASLYKLNIISTFRENENYFEGKIIGITKFGQLIVSTNDEDRIFNFKQIEFINSKK
ncbi:MAG: biotin--[acetyl-CoA-carboxylase] ligase [Sphingobacteriaceae bacterium]|nr:biotin--[acetyl-CoA-carboxylase] ligase [Sphingobacteriaceae bacterium]